MLSVSVRDRLSPPPPAKAVSAVGPEQLSHATLDAPSVSRRSPPSFCLPRLAGGHRCPRASDGTPGAGCGARRRWPSPRAAHRGRGDTWERDGDAAPSAGLGNAGPVGLGGVHRCHPDARATRLGAFERWRGSVDGASSGCRASGVVRRRPATVWRVRSGHHRLGSSALLRRGRALDATRARDRRGAGGRGRRREAPREQ